MVKKLNLVLLISICSLITSCTFAWKKQLTVGAKGAKAPQGKLEAGELLYKSDWYFNLGCKK